MPHEWQILQIRQREKKSRNPPHTTGRAEACPSHQCCDEGFAQCGLACECCDGSASEDDAERGGHGGHVDK
jgi:hypothetical protein